MIGVESSPSVGIGWPLALVIVIAIVCGTAIVLYVMEAWSKKR